MKRKTSLGAITLAAACLIVFGACAEPTESGEQAADEARVEAKAEALGSGVDQSFQAPGIWAQEFTVSQDWKGENPRLLADVDGNGRKDLVAFGNSGVWLGMSTGAGFTPMYVLADLGYNSGWRVAKHPRLAGDVNGDGRDDVVAFGDAGVWVATSYGAGLNGAAYSVAEFGYNQGWRTELHPRVLADVNGDGAKDVVGFANNGVYVSLGSPSGLGPAYFALGGFGVNDGWTIAKHPRLLGDVDGDGRDDVVGFGDAGVWVALADGGGGFKPMQYVIANFGYDAGGWRVARNPRLLADFDRDGKQDIVAFGDDGVWVARAAGGGAFEAPKFVMADFGYLQGWSTTRHVRDVADLNGDGYPDIVGFGEGAVYRALGGPAGFDPIRSVLRDLTAGYGYETATTPRLVGDVTGDGMSDLVAFNSASVKVARSGSAPPNAAPKAPSGLSITGRTSSSITVAWADNSSDERSFYINYGKGSSLTGTLTAAANVTTKTLSGLSSDTNYCFSVQAESLWGISAETTQQCARPLPSSGGGGGGGGGGPPLTVNQCGVGLSCPAGYHPFDYQTTATCPGNLENDNVTRCAINSGTFTSCGVRNCPSGWHATSFSFNLSCLPSYAGGDLDPNASSCTPDTQSFYACASCPPGYNQDASTSVHFCDGYPQVHCWK
jgi:hypothetical protein